MLRNSKKIRSAQILAICMVFCVFLVGTLVACKRVTQENDKSDATVHTAISVLETAAPTGTPTKATPTPNEMDLSQFAILPQYDTASQFSDFGYAVVSVSDGGSTKYGMIDETGAYVQEPQFDAVLDGYIYFGGNGYIWVEKDGKWGFLNEKCEMVIEPTYEAAAVFAVNGLAGVQVNGKWGFINEKGEEVIEPQFDGVDKFRDNGLSAVDMNGKWGLINEQGEMIVEPTYDFIFFPGDLTEWGAYQDNNLGILRVWDETTGAGFISETGEVLSEPQFQYMPSYGTDNLACVCADNKYGYIDEKGEVVIELQYEAAYDFAANGLALVCMDSKGGFINEKGETVIAPQFEDAESFSENGLAAVCKDGKYGYINEQGVFVIEPQFDSADRFDKYGQASVTVGDKVGLIDATGAFVIEPKYDYGYSLFRSATGTMLVHLDGLCGLIDEDAEYLIEPSFNYVCPPDPQSTEGVSFVNRTGLDLAMVSAGNMSGIISMSGKILIEPIAENDSMNVSPNGMVAIQVDGKWGYIKIDV